jgi:hypothetical protein
MKSLNADVKQMDDDSCLLGYDAASLGEQFLMF